MPVDEVVEHFFLSCLDAVPCSLDFPDGAFADFLIPFVQPSPGGIPCELLVPEHGTYDTYQRVCLPELRVQLEEQVGSFLLVLSPFVTRLGQYVSDPCKQLDERVAVAEDSGTELPFAYTFTTALLAFRLFLAGSLHGILGPAVCTPLGLGILVLLPRGLFFLRSRDGQPLESQAHFIEPLAETLHDVETVDDDCGIGEALADDGVHRVAEVHRHLFHLLALSQGDHLQDS